MPTHTFAPKSPSANISPHSEFPVIQFEAEKPYVQVIPKTLRALRAVTLRWTGLTNTDLDYIESFHHEHKGAAATFFYTLPRPRETPWRGPDLVARTSGSLPGRTYSVRFTWYDNVAGTETLASPASSITLAANDVVDVTTPIKPSGVDRFRIYAHETAGSEVLQATESTKTWAEPDTGLITGSATVPTVNTLKPKLKWRFIGPLKPTLRTVASGAGARYNLELSIQEEHV